MTFFLNREPLSTFGEPATQGAPTDFGENYGINFEAARKLESMMGLEYEFQEQDRRNLDEIERLTGEKMDGLSLDLAGNLAKRYAGEPISDDELSRSASYANVDINAQDKKFAELKQRFPQIKTRQEVFEQLRKEAQELNALRADTAERSTIGGWFGGFAGAMMGAFSERDPVNVASLGVGGFGRTMAAKILSEAGINSAVEAIDQLTGVAENKRILGIPQTPGQIATDIAAAGAGAGIIRGGLEVGGPIIKQAARATADYTRMSSAELLNRFRARIAETRVPRQEPALFSEPPSARAVDLALEREAEFLERANPNQENVATTAAHVRAVNAAEDALDGFPERFMATTPPVQPVFPQRIHVGLANEKSTPIGDAGSYLYGETKLRFDGEKDLLTILRDNREGGQRSIFLADKPELALGQGDNKGVTITYKADYVSGQEHRKPGTGELTGREYRTNYVAKGAISEIKIDKAVLAAERAAADNASLTTRGSAMIDKILAEDFHLVSETADSLTYRAKPVDQPQGTPPRAAEIADQTALQDELAYRQAIQPDSIAQTRAALDSYANTEEAQLLADYATLRESADVAATLAIEKPDGEIATVSMKDVFDEIDDDEALLTAFKTCGI